MCGDMHRITVIVILLLGLMCCAPVVFLGGLWWGQGQLPLRVARHSDEPWEFCLITPVQGQDDTNSMCYDVLVSRGDGAVPRLGPELPSVTPKTHQYPIAYVEHCDSPRVNKPIVEIVNLDAQPLTVTIDNGRYQESKTFRKRNNYGHFDPGTYRISARYDTIPKGGVYYGELTLRSTCQYVMQFSSQP